MQKQRWLFSAAGENTHSKNTAHWKINGSVGVDFLLTHVSVSPFVGARIVRLLQHRSRTSSRRSCLRTRPTGSSGTIKPTSTETICARPSTSLSSREGLSIFSFCLQLSELGGRSERSAGSGGPRRLHLLWHGCPRHPGQRTHAGSQSPVGKSQLTFSRLEARLKYSNDEKAPPSQPPLGMTP